MLIHGARTQRRAHLSVALGQVPKNGALLEAKKPPLADPIATAGDTPPTGTRLWRHFTRQIAPILATNLAVIAMRLLGILAMVRCREFRRVEVPVAGLTSGSLGSIMPAFYAAWPASWCSVVTKRGVVGLLGVFGNRNWGGTRPCRFLYAGAAPPEVIKYADEGVGAALALAPKTV